MIAAVDTNILLDVLIPDAPQGDASERILAEALRSGAVVISEPAYAELAAHFPEQPDLDRFLADTGLRLERSTPEALYRAGRSDRLLSRDRRLLRQYFPALKLG